MSKLIRLGILGYPLTHTMSPKLHTNFLKEAGLTGTYEKFEIPPEALETWLIDKKTQEITGFNVTIPHKIAIMPFLTEISQEAMLIGAVNTVAIRNHELHGYNTDVHGFLTPLNEETKASLKGKNAIILGAGGASRAVAYGLLTLGIKELTFWARNPERAQRTIAVVNKMNEKRQNGETIIRVTETLPETPTPAIIVNTTPIGMHPQTEKSPLPKEYLENLPKETLIYDLVYNPIETRLLREAKAQGLKTREGLSMLTHQGAKAFEIWTGHKPRIKPPDPLLSPISQDF